MTKLDEVKTIIEQIEKMLMEAGLTYVEISFIISELHDRHLAKRTASMLKSMSEKLKKPKEAKE